MRPADLLLPSLFLFSALIFNAAALEKPSEGSAAVEGQHHNQQDFYLLPKRASSFVGMRGKKSRDESAKEDELLSMLALRSMGGEGDSSSSAEEDSLEDEGDAVKRAAFMGMRGKKNFLASELKRAGFVGMRGKKATEEEESYDVPATALVHWQKRAGFVGMRGKKLEANYLSALHGSGGGNGGGVSYGYLPKARRGGGGSSSASGFVGMRGR